MASAVSIEVAPSLHPVPVIVSPQPAPEPHGEAAVARALRAAAAVEGPLGEAAAYHLRALGKLFRGRVALAASAALGLPRDSGLQLAVACELLHNASLVHDDLQDRDGERRGQTTVWKRFGEAMAVNLGDHLLTRALEQAAILDGANGLGGVLVRAFTEAVNHTLVGQSRDVTAIRAGRTSMDDYATLARGKTGPLLALPLEGALVLAGNDPLQRSAAREAMASLGLAYQIQDDLQELFGLEGGDSIVGEVDFTRPHVAVSAYLACSDPLARQSLQRFLRDPGSELESADWARRLRVSPAIAVALDQLDDARAECESRLGALPEKLADLGRLVATCTLRPAERLSALCLFARVERSAAA